MRWYNVLEGMTYFPDVLLIELNWIFEEEEDHSNEVLEVLFEVTEPDLTQNQLVVEMRLPPAKELK